MQEFLDAYVNLSATIVPVQMLFTAGIWSVAAKCGALNRGAPFDQSDARTWRLPYALGYSLVFALLISAILVLIPSNDFADLAALMAALAAARLTPKLVRYRSSGR